MGYSAADERFTHQYPRPFDEVHSTDGSWSDRCYFFAHSPAGDLVITNGYGNNPNQRTAMGYGKVAHADGRHWDLTSGRRVTGADREILAAGPMRWDCVEPLEHWKLEVGPNSSGVEWELHYRPRAPMWELLPMYVELDGGVILDMFHIKQSGLMSGWVQLDGERIELDDWPAGRDRTFGVRIADKIDFWLWLDVGFEDRSIQAWIIETNDGTVQYVDGGFTHTDGALSKRFTKIEHDITFDGDRKRPIACTLTFTDEDAKTYRVEATSPCPQANVHYGRPLSRSTFEDLGDGEYFVHFSYDGNDLDDLVAIESSAMSLDQVMRFELDGMTGHGIFEILSGGNGYDRYPNWPVMDMSRFRQRRA